MNLAQQPNGAGRATTTFAGERETRLASEPAVLQEHVLPLRTGPRTPLAFVEPEIFRESKGYQGVSASSFAIFDPLQGVSRAPGISPALNPEGQSTFAQPGVRLPRGIVDGFAKISDRWKLSDDDKATLLGLPGGSSLVRVILKGDLLPFTRDIRDRMTYVISISIGLGEIFQDDLDSELSWLHRRRAELYDQSPMTYILEGSMRNLFKVSDIVLHIRGL